MSGRMFLEIIGLALLVMAATFVFGLIVMIFSEWFVRFLLGLSYISFFPVLLSNPSLR